MSGNELGIFLRTHREAVTPADVGLPHGSRRRTPGLRRAELATLAGVSVDYLARLEQGRDNNPSAQVLAVLADVLRLSADERFHLLLISKQSSGEALLCPPSGSYGPARSVRPTVQAVLDRLEPAPAFVVNRVGDILAFTTGYSRLVSPHGLLDDQQPNLLRFVFTDPRARVAFPDWSRVADEQVANLKRASCPVEEYVRELSITAGAAFTERLETPAVPRNTGIERMAHPEAGELRLVYETLELTDLDDQRLVVYLPGDDATESAVDQLVRRAPGVVTPSTS